MKQVINLKNSLTSEQKAEMSAKIEAIMTHYGQRFDTIGNMYFAGFIEGLNAAYKIVNSFDDDYNCGL